VDDTSRVRLRLSIAGLGALTLVLLSSYDLEARFVRAQQEAFAPGWERGLATRHHRGGGPCRRWLTDAELDAADTASVAAALVARGLAPRSFEVLALAWRCADREERAHHEGSTKDELVAAATTQLGVFDELWFRALGKRHLDALGGDVDATRAELEAQALRAEARLGAETTRALEAMCAAHPKTFSRVGLTRVFPAVRRALSEAALDGWARRLSGRTGGGALRDVGTATRAIPLVDLVAALGLERAAGPDAPLEDGWGRPLTVETTSQGVVLRALGADGRPGGRGDDADAVRVLAR
jgi:hypothetical protein